MKEKLEAGLKELANTILNTNASSVGELKGQAKELYEKLTILAFTEENLAAFSSGKTEAPVAITTPSEEKEQSHPQAAQAPEPVEAEEKDDYLPDGTEYNESAITEPNTEKIKDIVAQMPEETEKLDFLVNSIISKESTPPIRREEKQEQIQEERQEERQERIQEQEPEQKQEHKPEERQEEKRDFRDIGVDYDNLPNFEPVRKTQERERPKSLNDRLKKGFNIGLNERLAFIRHLFEGNTADYNRVISQLNTFNSLEEAQKFIQLVVKPDYKNWEGKEEFENKFMELVENKFGH